MTMLEMTDADWSELDADFESQLDAYAAEWEASIRAHLKLSAPPIQLSADADWTPFTGPRGGKGWKNTRTGVVHYGDRPPAHGEAVDSTDDGEENAGEAAGESLEAPAPAHPAAAHAAAIRALYDRSGDVSIPFAEVEAGLAKLDTLKGPDLKHVAAAMELRPLARWNVGQLRQAIKQRVLDRRSAAQRAAMIARESETPPPV